MADHPEAEFLWSDAWLLLAVGMVSKSEGAVLRDIIGAADAIQHAIVTRDELNGAIGRLARTGILRFQDGRLWLTGKGRRLLTAAERVGRTYEAQERALTKALGAAPWNPDYDPADALGGEAEVVPADAFTRAVKEYQRSVRLPQ